MNLTIIIFTLINIISLQVNAAETDDINISNTIQSAGNLTVNTWNTELLDFQAKYIAENGEKSAKEAFIEHGGNPADWIASTKYESNFVLIRGEKFGITKTRLVINPMNFNSVTNTIKINVIRGGDFISVACGRQSAKEISIIDGPCDEAIRKNLGISFSVASYEAVPNREIIASAAVTNSFAKNMLIGIGVILILSIPTIWMLRKPKNNPTSKAYREGHLACQNALDENSNPYLEKDGNLSKSWLNGYRNALMIRKKRES